jgi:hypothetical protein
MGWVWRLFKPESEAVDNHPSVDAPVQPVPSTGLDSALGTRPEPDTAPVSVDVERAAKGLAAQVWSYGSRRRDRLFVGINPAVVEEFLAYAVAMQWVVVDDALVSPGKVDPSPTGTTNLADIEYLGLGPFKRPGLRGASPTAGSAQLRRDAPACSTVKVEELRSCATGAATGSVIGLLGLVELVMFRTLSPRAAADLARHLRQATGGMDSDWPHLVITGSHGYLSALVKRHLDGRDRAKA